MPERPIEEAMTLLALITPIILEAVADEKLKRKIAYRCRLMQSARFNEVRTAYEAAKDLVEKERDDMEQTQPVFPDSDITEYLLRKRFPFPD